MTYDNRFHPTPTLRFTMAAAHPTAMRFRRLLLTGAAGGLGRELRGRLKAYCDTLRLSHRKDMGPAGEGEEIVALAAEDVLGVVELGASEPARAGHHAFGEHLLVAFVLEDLDGEVVDVRLGHRQRGRIRCRQGPRGGRGDDGRRRALGAGADQQLEEFGVEQGARPEADEAFARTIFRRLHPPMTIASARGLNSGYASAKPFSRRSRKGADVDFKRPHPSTAYLGIPGAMSFRP